MAGARVRIEGQSDVGETISADLASAQSALKKMESGSKEVSSATNGLDKAVGMLGGTLGALGIPLTVAGLINLAAELDKVGAAANRAESSLNAMTGGRALKWTSDMQGATHGLIDDTDAAAVATQLLSSGMATTSTEAAHFVEVATILGGAIKGLDAKTASEELANMFSSGNTRAAKDFGLSVIELRDRVNELKAADSGLSDQQALIKAFMEQADPLAAKLAGTLDDQVAAIQKLDVAWSDLGETIGQAEAKGLAPAQETGAAFLNMLNDMLKGTDLAKKSIQDYNPAAQDLSQYTEEQVMAMRRAGLEVRAYAAGVAVTDPAVTGLTVALRDQAPTMDELVAKIKDYNSVLQTQAGLQLNAQSQVGALTGLWWGAGTSTKAAASDIADLNDALAKETSKLADLNQWGGSDKSFAKTNEAIADLTGKLQDANSQVAFGPGANWPKIFEFAGQQMQQMNLPASELLTKMNELGLATGQVTPLQIAQGSALRELNNLYVDGTINTQTYLSGLSQIPAAQDAVAASAIAVKAAVQEATSAAAASGASAASIIQTAIDTAKSAKATAAPEAANGIVQGVQTALDQINAMPGAQLKLLPDDAMAAINSVSDAVKNLALTAATSPAVMAADTSAAQGQVNALTGAIDKVPKYTDVEVHVSVTGDPVPQFAGGVTDFSGGVAMVGERGPELLVLPPHSSVVPNGATAKAQASGASGGSSVPMGGDTYYINITAQNGASLQDLIMQARQMQAGG